MLVLVFILFVIFFVVFYMAYQCLYKYPKVKGFFEKVGNMIFYNSFIRMFLQGYLPF
jgi:hypothetical protein